MNGNERRNRIIRILNDSQVPVSGRSLALQLNVSRQVIVQDIALLRAQDIGIESTNLGYVLRQKTALRRVFKVAHSDEQVMEELNTVVDYGGTVEDVFIYHKVYGTVRAELNIRSRKDVESFLQDLARGKSGLLKNVTSGYHYHTVSASSVQLLDLIQQQLAGKGFLAQLQDYEPVNFWEEKP